MKTIPEPVLSILSAMEFDSNLARITGEQLDRKLYVEVNKVLEALGGKWSKSKRGHVFELDPKERIEEAILSGTYDRMKTGREAYDFFPTPRTLADMTIARAQLREGLFALEPSAGDGVLSVRMAITLGFKRVHVIEKRGDLARKLHYQGDYGDLRCLDFITVEPEPVYDRVVMNPPFSKRQDIAHILHAFKFLRPGGRLVAIASAGVAFRNDRLGVEFREHVTANNGSIIPNPSGSFKESGTDVNTVTVVMERAA